MKYINLFTKKSLQTLKKLAETNQFDLESICEIVSKKRLPVEKVTEAWLQANGVKPIPRLWNQKIDQSPNQSVYQMGTALLVGFGLGSHQN